MQSAGSAGGYGPVVGRECSGTDPDRQTRPCIHHEAWPGPAHRWLGASAPRHQFQADRSAGANGPGPQCPKSQRRVSGMLPIAGQASEESPLLSCQCSSHRTILSPALHHDTDTCSRSGNALRHPARAVAHPYTPGNASQQCLRVPIGRREGGRPYLALWRLDTARTRMSITPNHVPTSRYV